MRGTSHTLVLISIFQQFLISHDWDDRFPYNKVKHEYLSSPRTSILEDGPAAAAAQLFGQSKQQRSRLKYALNNAVLLLLPLIER